MRMGANTSQLRQQGRLASEGQCGTCTYQRLPAQHEVIEREEAAGAGGGKGRLFWGAALEAHPGFKRRWSVGPRLCNGLCWAGGTRAVGPRLCNGLCWAGATRAVELAAGLAGG